MNFKLFTQALAAFKNVQAHPKTTIFGALTATAVSLTGTADLKHALIALAVLLLGALAQDPLKKAN